MALECPQRGGGNVKIIRPITITAAMLTSTDVAETDYAAWAVGTVFTAGDKCIVVATHKIYIALVDVTGGSSPEVDVLATTPKWAEVSATNRWKVFDAAVGSQTTQATSMTYKITTGEQFDSIAFLNCDAASIQIVMTDPAAGEVYNETVYLLSTLVAGANTVYDWHSYFFSSYFRISDVVKLDIPPFLNAVLDITLTYAGGTVKCGGIVLGLQATIGETQYSPSIGIRDYSTKEADTYGIYRIVERAFSKRLTCDATVPAAAVDTVESLLAYYRAKPLVWVASESYSSMIIYGYCSDFGIVISYPTFAMLSIEIEGLT